MSTSTISPAEFAQVCREDRGVELIDVRTPAEFREVHLRMAKNIPLGELDTAAVMKQRASGGGKPLYVICRSGGRARQACDLLRKAGCEDAILVEGGTEACFEAGMPVDRGPKAISLERQVRIAAGAIVLIGAALAGFVHPAFIGLCAFVGAGLMFAGITDTCGMGIVLSRMPWNRSGQCGPSSCSLRTAGNDNSGVQQ
ncbi:MAG: rhodanese-like domain-containing protein [Pirellulales bacterium]|nr:rhodanese-like domain-containing protein [Pirellulales bacterium]